MKTLIVLAAVCAAALLVASWIAWIPVGVAGLSWLYIELRG